MAPHDTPTIRTRGDVYVPCQHRAKVAGRGGMMLFANVEISDDDPPEAILLGGNVYELVEKNFLTTRQSL